MLDDYSGCRSYLFASLIFVSVLCPAFVPGTLSPLPLREPGGSAIPGYSTGGHLFIIMSVLFDRLVFPPSFILILLFSLFTGIGIYCLVVLDLESFSPLQSLKSLLPSNPSAI